MDFISLGQIGLFYDIVGAITVAASFLLASKKEVLKTIEKTTVRLTADMESFAATTDIEGLVQARADAIAGVAALVIGFSLQALSPWTTNWDPMVLVPIEIVALAGVVALPGVYIFVRPMVCAMNARAIRIEAGKTTTLAGGRQ